ncbi:MAG: sugar transferase [Deltaproteobacteria bacterium]|nr:sugar transferase [Deltaproteobacteria bacterium]
MTRVGRFLRQYRINELPQLLHVLSGRMALIGPRPDISAVMEIYRSISPAAELRLAVKPGLTGWAKVNHGRLGDRACNLEYDLYWLGHRSIPLGLEILFRTVRVVLTGHGGG